MPNLIRSYSLTRRLSLILLAITTSVWVGSLGCIYWGMQRAANNIFDKSLAETAHALLSTTSSTLEGRVPDHTVIEKAQGEHYNQIIFQIWHKNGNLIYRSVGVDTHPFVQQAKFGWIKIHNQTYRSYSIWDNTHTIQVQIAQVWTIRQDIQSDMLLFLIVVSGFFLPLLSWLIIRTIRSHLATVFSISQNLEKQSIEHLKPINPIVPKEIEPLVNSLNTLLSEIAESMQREKRFTSNAAHELRTPLAAIRMHAQVLLSARSTEEARESAQDIMIGIDKASRMITQLLTLARIEHLDERSEVSVDLCIIIQKTLTLMDFKIVKENIDIQLDLKPAPILAKAEHLEIILRNIIENAIIYRSQNGISIIKITCGSIENRTFFQVEDNGIGVEEEKMPYILQRFYRANQNSSVIGSGLGLSIVKQMVDLYHGKIEVSQASIGGFLIRIEFNK
ncbi:MULTISPECIES: ATP-binding protein [Acinetobacter]|jgi:two-component system sensor histidine kinase QseC|uniref:ATP-binding protein n=1 Tax=Acinetobacter TaxID=469 RepID=UPI00037D876A|nr:MULTISPECIES: ATP-binding protein [Acinetobacter]MCY0273957.1 sensor histidine kinase N-terminal domain-containing protein [Acinetobacter baumannii]RXS91725.1 GHKL domain-containing protein [Acinetobacter junii]